MKLVWLLLLVTVDVYLRVASCSVIEILSGMGSLGQGSFRIHIPMSSPTKHNCRCGSSKSLSRVVNGVDVMPKNKYPWHVGLKRFENKKYDCGGVIINDLYVLTAAHCLMDKYKPIFPWDLQVGIGDHDMTSYADDDDNITKLVHVQKIILHHGYKWFSYDNDIALVKLESRLKLGVSNVIGAVCLPANNHAKYFPNLGIATGWGILGPGQEQASILQEVPLAILPLDCWGYAKMITKNMLCAFPVYGDTCLGDSGGPLVVWQSNRYILVGLTSFSFGICNYGRKPSVYTRITRYLEWIKNNTGDAKYCNSY